MDLPLLWVMLDYLTLQFSGNILVVTLLMVLKVLFESIFGVRLLATTVEANRPQWATRSGLHMCLTATKPEHGITPFLPPPVHKLNRLLGPT